MNNKDYNLAILKQIEVFVNKYPDLRFHQILDALELNLDKYYEKSSFTLQKLNDILDQEKKGE